MTEKIQVRNAHPYFMYESVQAQPESVRNALAANRETSEKLAQTLAQKKWVYLVGIGTSSHAAMAGEYFFRLLCGPKLDAQFIQSFEFVHYPPPIDADAAVILVTHRGWKTFSEQATQMVKAKGAFSISVTGKNPQKEVALSENVLLTSEQESSSAHTVSYVTAMAVLLQLAQSTAHALGTLPKSANLLGNLPDLLQSALALEKEMEALAERLKERKHFFFVGTGPNIATAFEATLKMQETTFTAALGYEIEQFLHGPFASAGPQTAVFLIAPPGPGRKRFFDAARALREIGAESILLTEDDRFFSGAPVGHTFYLPPMPEVATPPVYVIPLQFFAYFVSLKLGHQVDLNHRDDPRYQKASEQFSL
jgi:glucosamine--fructose-6-phosphate aminotransferase (isomerizing)